MKKIMIIIMMIFYISSIFATDNDLWVIESGDDELYIGYSILDTPGYDTITQGVNEQSSGGRASGSAGYSRLNLDLGFDVLGDRYESGQEVESTLITKIPQKYLEQGGYFEYYLIDPNGKEYDLKRVRIENSSIKLLSYELPEDAINGIWTIKGVLKIDGYKEIKVEDTFRVQNYKMFIWYLLAIIIFTIIGLLQYLKTRRY